MMGTEKREMGNLGKKYLIYTIAIAIFYMVSLAVLTQMKVQEPIESVEYMGANAGVYEAECFIRDIPVSKTVIISAGLGGFTVTSQNYPTMFLLPIATSAVALLVFAILMRVIEFGVMKINHRKIVW